MTCAIGTLASEEAVGQRNALKERKHGEGTVAVRVRMKGFDAMGARGGVADAVEGDEKSLEVLFTSEEADDELAPRM